MSENRRQVEVENRDKVSPAVGAPIARETEIAQAEANAQADAGAVPGKVVTSVRVAPPPRGAWSTAEWDALFAGEPGIAKGEDGKAARLTIARIILAALVNLEARRTAMEDAGKHPCHVNLAPLLRSARRDGAAGATGADVLEVAREIARKRPEYVTSDNRAEYAKAALPVFRADGTRRNYNHWIAKQSWLGAPKATAARTVEIDDEATGGMDL